MTETGAADPRRTRLITVAVFLLAALPFVPSLWNGFVNWDDQTNFTDNPFYRGLGWTHLKWMWTTYHMGHYIPLSWMTLGFDYTLWGMNPAGYHLSSMVLHGLNAVVLLAVARRVLSRALGEDRSSITVVVSAAIGVLFFAMHPLRVESVAWATERRDVLSGLFSSLLALVYLKAIERGTITTRQYAPIFLLFVAALLSKASVMTLPLALLVMNVYPLRRLTSWRWSDPGLRAVAKELTPLLMLSFAAMNLSVTALGPRPQLSIPFKLAVSAFSGGFYLLKTMLPSGLGPLYQMPTEIPYTSMPFVASYITLAVLAVIVVSEWKQWPGFTAGMIASLVLIAPMLGAVQNGPQIAADRYTYLPSMALAVMIGGGFALLWRRTRGVSIAVSATTLTALAAGTWVQTTYWRDSMTMWTRVVSVSPGSGMGYDGVGTAYFQRGDSKTAVQWYERALTLDPENAGSHMNMGMALVDLRRFDEAIQHLEKATLLKPGNSDAETNWGVALALQGNIVSSVGHYKLALMYDPENFKAELNWANALVAASQLEESLSHYKRAITLNPSLVEAEARLGAALAELGRLEEAIPHFRRVLELNPGDAHGKDLLDRATRELSERKSRSTK